MSSTGENVVRIEAEALTALAHRLAGPMKDKFERALDLLHRCEARVVVTGMGKSGIIAQKIAATLSSTGTPALFMHPVEAVHGDLGTGKGGPGTPGTRARVAAERTEDAAAVQR